MDIFAIASGFQRGKGGAGSRPRRRQSRSIGKTSQKYLRKNTYKAAVLQSPMTGDFFRVVRWSKPDTAVFWAFSSDTGLGALAELRVDRGGNWKLVTAKVLSGTAAEKQQYNGSASTPNVNADHVR